MTPRKVLEVLRAELGSATPDALELDAVLGAVPDSEGWGPVWDYLVDRAAGVREEPSQAGWVALWMCAAHVRDRLPLQTSEIVAASRGAVWVASLAACAQLTMSGDLPGSQLGVAIVRHGCLQRVDAPRPRSAVLRASRVALTACFASGDSEGAARFLSALRGAPAWSPPSWGDTGLPLYVRAGLFGSLHDSLLDLGRAWVSDVGLGARALGRLSEHGELAAYARDAAACAACAQLRSGTWANSVFESGVSRLRSEAAAGLERTRRARSFGAYEMTQQDVHAGVVRALTAAEALLAVGQGRLGGEVAREVDAELARLVHSDGYRRWARDLVRGRGAAR
jgi:hypothetical protein